MPALAVVKGQKIRASRAKRLEEIIAPMYAQGATTRQIAEAAGISQRQVMFDLDLVRDTWAENFDSRLETARGELVVKHDYIYREAVGQYRQGGGIKALELASKELECLARLFGIANGVSLNLHNHSHLHAQVDTAAVADLFKPLDTGTYAAMVATRVLPQADPESVSNPDDLLSNAPADTQSQLEEVKPTALEPDWPPANDNQPSVIASEADTQAPAETVTKSRRIKHPMM